MNNQVFVISGFFFFPDGYIPGEQNQDSSGSKWDRDLISPMDWPPESTENV